MNKLRELFANEKFQEEAKRGAINLAMIVVVLTIVLSLTSVNPQDMNVLGLQPIKHANPETFNQAVTFNANVAATQVTAGGAVLVTPVNTAVAAATATEKPNPTVVQQINSNLIVTGTLQAGGVQATAISANSMSILGTPVIPYSTPIPTYAYTAPTVVQQINSNLIVTGTLTAGGGVVITPVATATAIPTTTPFPYIIRGGTELTYTSGVSITHGFSAAPTWCVINPGSSNETTYVITSIDFTSTISTTLYPIYWQCGKAP